MESVLQVSFPSKDFAESLENGIDNFQIKYLLFLTRQRFRRVPL